MKGRERIKSVRRQQLIQATLEAINDVGLADTTIVQIAQRAGLSTGIISHYFGDKDGLLVAVMQHIMQDLHQDTQQRRKVLVDAGEHSAKAQLLLTIDVNLSLHQTSATMNTAWLAFWAASMHKPALRRLNRINEKRMYTNLFHHFSRQLPREKAHTAAIGLAALIEGLWLRRALLCDEFDLITARVVAYQYVEQQLALADGRQGITTRPAQLV